MHNGSLFKVAVSDFARSPSLIYILAKWLVYCLVDHKWTQICCLLSNFCKIMIVISIVYKQKMLICDVFLEISYVNPARPIQW